MPTKRRLLLVAAFLLPLALLVLIGAILSLAPFGSRTFCTGRTSCTALRKSSAAPSPGFSPIILRVPLI